jgi:hypothetical protein
MHYQLGGPLSMPALAFDAAGMIDSSWYRERTGYVLATGQCCFNY